MVKVHIPVSLGELVDKLTILEIKSSMFTDEGKLRNVRRELEQLEYIWQIGKFDKDLIASEWAQLRAVNSRLWDIEDRKRLKEASASFDEEFIALARSVYFENDRRAAIKRTINEKLGSDLVEEKTYSDYRRNGVNTPRI